jgi:hypothetical protein
MYGTGSHGGARRERQLARGQCVGTIRRDHRDVGLGELLRGERAHLLEARIEHEPSTP